MADQGKWFKLWCSALDDNDLENLSIHEWFCWARLGTYIKKHGNEGKIVFSSPARALTNLFRVTDFPTALDLIKRFPNCVLGERSITVTGETNSTVTVDIEYLNWFRYQGDFSNDRVRKFRDKKRHAVTAQEEKRSRREEKRKEESINTLAKTQFSRPTPDQVTAYAQTIHFKLDGNRFCAYYDSNGWKVGKAAMKDWRGAVRTWKLNDTGESNASNGRKELYSPIAVARAAAEAQKL